MNHLIILRTLSICINIYLFLLFIRIICTWFKPSVDGKLWHYLCLITGPYLALFKGIKFLRRGIFDFTPILAISLLGVTNQILQRIILHFEAGFGFSIIVLLALIVLSVWNIVSFVLLFFDILCVIRLIGIFLHINKTHKVLQIIDMAIQPITSIVMKIIPKKLDYVKLLFLSFLFLTAIWLSGIFIFNYVARLILSFPL
ncbi:MAG: YggT family protein [Spirochaetales bacterium]|nr:YggT family protein [Spirochaetales bacterium]